MSSINFLVFLAAMTTSAGNFNTKPVGVLVSRANLERNTVQFEPFFADAAVAHSDSFSPETSTSGKGAGWLIFNLTKRNSAAVETVVTSPASGQYVYSWPGTDFVSQLRELNIATPEINTRVLNANGEVVKDMEAFASAKGESEERQVEQMKRKFYFLESEVPAKLEKDQPEPPPVFSPRQSIMVEFGEINAMKKRWEELQNPDKSAALAVDYYKQHFQTRSIEISLAVTNPQLGSEESPLPDTARLTLVKHAKAPTTGGYLTSPQKAVAKREETANSPFPLRVQTLKFEDQPSFTMDAKPLIDYVIRPLLAPEGRLEDAPSLECVINSDANDPKRSACSNIKLADGKVQTVISGDFVKQGDGKFQPLTFAVRDPNYKREEYRVKIMLQPESANPPKGVVEIIAPPAAAEKN